MWRVRRAANQLCSLIPPPPGPPAQPPTRVLLVHSHPSPSSFNAVLASTVEEALVSRGSQVKVISLYHLDSQGTVFDPVLSRNELEGYLHGLQNKFLSAQVREHVKLLQWADALVFVYPTWWFGLPAILKGWLDKVLLPDVAFRLGEERHKHSLVDLVGCLKNIEKIGVVTTYGTKWLASRFVQDPGRSTIARALRHLCHPSCTVLWVGLHQIDESTLEQRKQFVERVAAKFGVF